VSHVVLSTQIDFANDYSDRKLVSGDCVCASPRSDLTNSEGNLMSKYCKSYIACLPIIIWSDDFSSIKLVFDLELELLGFAD